MSGLEIYILPPNKYSFEYIKKVDKNFILVGETSAETLPIIEKAVVALHRLSNSDVWFAYISEENLFVCSVHKGAK